VSPLPSAFRSCKLRINQAPHKNETWAPSSMIMDKSMKVELKVKVTVKLAETITAIAVLVFVAAKAMGYL